MWKLVKKKLKCVLAAGIHSPVPPYNMSMWIHFCAFLTCFLLSLQGKIGKEKGVEFPR